MFLLAVDLKAQDIHFSQFSGSLLNLSPGYTGFFNADYRLGAIYRSQWQTVPVGYSTFSMQGEKRLKPLSFEKDMVGVGLVFNNDRAGDSRYGSTQLYLNGNYIWLGKPDSSLIVTLGGSAGWGLVTYDYSKMTFDSQYDGLQYNRGLASGEGFNYSSRNFLDLGFGSVIQYIAEEKHRFSLGLGIHHLTRPQVAFYATQNDRLDRRFTSCISYNTDIGVNAEIIGELLFSSQASNREVIPHVSLKYYLSKSDNQSLLAGVCYRTSDAAVVRLGYTHRMLQSGMSYDINLSRFTAATNYRGGFEIFVNYLIRNKPSFIARKRACPVFM